MFCIRSLAYVIELAPNRGGREERSGKLAARTLPTTALSVSRSLACCKSSVPGRPTLHIAHRIHSVNCCPICISKHQSSFRPSPHELRLPARIRRRRHGFAAQFAIMRMKHCRQINTGRRNVAAASQAALRSSQKVVRSVGANVCAFFLGPPSDLDIREGRQIYQLRRRRRHYRGRRRSERHSARPR